jgi:hypothetical protein
VSIQLVEIILDRDEALCLFKHADKTSMAWATLKVSITSWIVIGIPAPAITIQCAQDTARALLHIAETHCQTAAPKIKQALTDGSFIAD